MHKTRHEKNLDAIIFKTSSRYANVNKCTGRKGDGWGWVSTERTESYSRQHVTLGIFLEIL